MTAFPIFSVTDPSVLPDDPESVATFVLIYDQRPLPDGALRFKQVLERIRTRLQHFPRFQQLLKSVDLLGRPRWAADEGFDVEFHVRHLALPKPGDWRQFCIQVARLHARPLDLSRPLWEISVIEGLDNISWLGEGHFALVCKVHQALIDPKELHDLVWSLHDDIEPSAVPGASLPVMLFPVQKMLNDTLSFVLRPAEEALSQSRRVLHRSRDHLTPIMRFYHSALTGSQRVPYTRFNTDVSSFRVWQGCSFERDDIGQIRRAVGSANDTDVLLAVIAGALRRYLADKTELPAGELAIVTSALPPANEAADAASLAVRSLAVQVACPLERLAWLSRDRREGDGDVAPGRPLPDAAATSVQIARASQRIQAAQRAEAGAPLANTALIDACVAVPPSQLKGAPLVYCSGVAAIGNGLGLVHLATRQQCQLHLSVTSCREMLPDPDFYIQCLERSFAELLVEARTIDERVQVPS